MQGVEVWGAMEALRRGDMVTVMAAASGVGSVGGGPALRTSHAHDLQGLPMTTFRIT